jgi:glutaminase
VPASPTHIANTIETELLQRVAAAVPSHGAGRVADYIPALASADPAAFGFAVATVDGEVYGTGSWLAPFSIQSIAKVFSLSLAVARDAAAVWGRVGREPSGDPFNSLAALEHASGIPPNPFVNAGALVVTDVLREMTGDACGAVLDFVREESGNPTIGFNAAVAASEADNGDRNAALAHLLASYGNLRGPVDRVLDDYVRQCAVEMSCRDLALAGTFLARHGVRRDATRLLSRSDAKRINAIMLMCGVYDAAGEFAYRVGLPAKSGVGGGILAVIPNRCALCAWSPGLDAAGNSVAAVAALDAFTTMTGWSVF